MKYSYQRLEFSQGIKLIGQVKNKKESTAYQREEFLRYYRMSQNFRVIGLRPEINILHKEFFFIVVRDEIEVCCLMPCEYNKKSKTLSLAGDQKQLNIPYCNVDTFGMEAFAGLIEFCKKETDADYFFFQNIDIQTKFYELLSNYCQQLKDDDKIQTVTKCVSIDNVNNNYDEWFKSLSKSVRQNVRTSYNHLKSDGVQMEVRHKLGGAKLSVVRRCMYLQRRRNLEKRGSDYPAWKLKPLLWIGSWLSLINPRVQMLMKSEVSYLCEIWLNGELAAFVGGYLSSNGRFFIPFLKYNMDFKRYSPGGLAICESIKYLCDTDYTLNRYDLLTGDEPYKYSYGGTDYDNANIKIRLK